jgi:SNF2 family DNA or RNA helicase
MLDILEAFVNLHGLTYLRLDGSVGVDERQRLMDRFNNDQKIFCFILSTRSGGLGINLTGGKIFFLARFFFFHDCLI